MARGGGIKNSELLDEAVKFIVEMSEFDRSVCYESSTYENGCVTDCDKCWPDDGCVLHLLRMRISKNKKEK